MIVRIKETNKSLGVKKGELYTAVPYWLDPTSKCSLEKNLKTGKPGTCNQYWSDVEIVDGDRSKEVHSACAGYNQRVDDFLTILRKNHPV